MAALDQVMAANEGDLDYALVIDYSQQRIRTVLYQFGSMFFDPADSKHLIFDSPETRAGIDFLLSLFLACSIKCIEEVSTKTCCD